VEEATQLGAEAKEAEREERVPAGGTLVVALANPVKSIEPDAIETDDELEISANVYETLLATDSRGNLAPLLCEKWEVLENGRKFLFTLRPNVRFSDGVPLTARDVKASFEASMRLRSEMPAAFAVLRGAAEYRGKKADEVVGIVAHGDGELQVDLLEPLPILPALLTQGRTAVVRLAREAGGENGSTLGTGPFRLASLGPARAVLESNPEYWKSGLPRLNASSSGRRLPPRPSPKRFVPESSIWRATSSPRTSKRSSGTAAFARGWSKRPRRTPISCFSTP
jgi:ABC-type transport system substrate-binding protein